MRCSAVSGRLSVLHRQLTATFSSFGGVCCPQRTQLALHISLFKSSSVLGDPRGRFCATRAQGLREIEMPEIKDKIEVSDVEQKIFDELLDVVKQVSRIGRL